MKIIGIIPARHASTRFPAKALAQLGEKTIIERVYEQVKKSTHLTDVVVATDHQDIYDHVAQFGGKVMMTSNQHPSGTDRCLEIVENIGEPFDYAINIQGDEPFIAPSQIDSLAAILDGKTEIATLMKAIDNVAKLFDPNVVKVVTDQNDRAIYFSRQALPYLRGIEKAEWLKHYVFYKHLGIYAYRTDILKIIAKLPVAELEKSESLEQLRWIANGYKIRVLKTDIESIGIDTPEDLEEAKKLLNLSGL